MSYSEIFDVVVAAFLLLPEGEVLLEQLDDALGIAECLLVDVIDLVHGLLEGSLSEDAGLLAVLHHLVVENREVQG